MGNHRSYEALKSGSEYLFIYLFLALWSCWAFALFMFMFLVYLMEEKILNERVGQGLGSTFSIFTSSALLVNVWQLILWGKERRKFWFVSFADVYGVNVPILDNFKLPMGQQLAPQIPKNLTIVSPELLWPGSSIHLFWGGFLLFCFFFLHSSDRKSIHIPLAKSQKD